MHIVPENGWHVYWRNPGDSGLATALNWTLPPGVTAGELQWPYPHRSQLGDIVNYGYDKVRFPVPLPSWTRVRMRLTLQGADRVPGGIQVRSLQVFEGEGMEKPVAVAEALARIVE